MTMDGVSEDRGGNSSWTVKLSRRNEDGTEGAYEQIVGAAEKEQDAVDAIPSRQWFVIPVVIFATVAISAAGAVSS